MTEKEEKLLLDEDERKKYEFRDEDVAIFRTERGLSEKTVREISAIKKAYAIFYLKHKTLEEALPLLDELAATEPVVQPFVDFIKANGRGIIR